MVEIKDVKIEIERLQYSPEDWGAIGNLNQLFRTDLPVESASHELRAILQKLFDLDSCSLFSYTPKDDHPLFDLLEQMPLQMNRNTPFLAQVYQYKENHREWFSSPHEDLCWLYVSLFDEQMLILVIEGVRDLSKEKLASLKGVLRIWYMKVQIIISETKRKRLLNQITQFRSIGEELAKSHRLEDILLRILNTSIELVDAEKGHIMVYDEEAGELRVRIAKGFGSEHTDKMINEGKIKLEGLKVGEGIQGRVYATRTSMRHSEKNPLLGGAMQDHLSVICVPLAMNDEVFGVLHITNKKNFAPFEDTDLDIINILATNVAAVLNKHKLFKKSSTDHLTGLANRAYFEEKATSEMQRCRRYGQPFSLLIMDVDFFKKVNDTHGHLVGDEVLKFVASKLKNNLRNEIDLAARYGGEEFVLLLPETPLQGAKVVAERIRHSLETSQIIRNSQIIKVTISIGVTEASEGNHLTELYEEADKALYYCKEHGRNQFKAFQEI